MLATKVTNDALSSQNNNKKKRVLDDTETLSDHHAKKAMRKADSVFQPTQQESPVDSAATTIDEEEEQKAETLLPAATENGGGNKNFSGSQKIGETETHVTWRKTVLRTGQAGLARYARLAGGSVTTTFRKISASAGHAAKLVRSGIEIWRDAQGRTVARRHFDDNGLLVEHQVWCFAVQRLKMADKPQKLVWVELAKKSLVYEYKAASGVVVQRDLHPAGLAGRYVLGKVETQYTVAAADGKKNGAEIRLNTVSGRRLYECCRKDGKKHGTEDNYFRNGHLHFTVEWADGVRDATSLKVFFRDGTPRFAYANEKLLATWWNKQNNVVHSISFDANGCKNGPEIWYKTDQTDVVSRCWFWSAGQRITESGERFQWPKQIADKKANI